MSPYQIASLTGLHDLTDGDAKEDEK